MSYTLFLCGKNRKLIERPLSIIENNENIMKNVKILIGSHNSFSEMVNHCLKMCKTEIFIFSSHRVLITEENINLLIKLLEDGYGFVGLYHFGFFGFYMDLVKKIGYFDENFIPGGYEDDDFQLRLMLNDIAIYDEEREDINFDSGQSTWTSKDSKTYPSYAWFLKKYTIDYENKIIRNNNKHFVDLSIERKFKKFHESEMQRLRSLFYRQRFFLYQII